MRKKIPQVSLLMMSGPWINSRIQPDRGLRGGPSFNDEWAMDQFEDIARPWFARWPFFQCLLWACAYFMIHSN
jgi:hypothetical protein